VREQEHFPEQERGLVPGFQEQEPELAQALVFPEPPE